jgi:Ser/Thr protein kinase RdoA (MazF antagonist)
LLADLHPIAEKFAGGHNILSISPLGNGLINNTYRVKTEASGFVLQSVNRQVFQHPELISSNLQQLNLYLKQSRQKTKLKIPDLILTETGEGYYTDAKQCFWRALELIQPAESRECIQSSAEAEQVGYALAHFHQLCSGMQTDSLHDTLPGFHQTPLYFQHYQKVKANNKQPASQESEFCEKFIHFFKDRLDCLEAGKMQGKLQERVIHGDPKLNNFLFEPESDRIISLIDLDTLKPGLIHYDIGDCLRSCCHSKTDNSFDLEICKTLLSAYLREADSFISAADYDYLYQAILLIPFELGLRFYTDYLQGNTYFKTNQPLQNLHRAMAQFQLCQSISNQARELEKIIMAVKPY